MLYRGKLFGRVHRDRPLKPIVIPIVLVQHAIKGADGDMPFHWIEPSGNGVHGYFIVVANEIDTLDAFIMNSLRVLGPRMTDAETAHVTSMLRDIKQANITGRGIAVLVIGAAIAGILASAQVLPLATTIAIFQYWYVVAIVIIGGLSAMGYVYRGLDKRVARVMGARAAAVTGRTPFLVVPGWEDIVPGARRIGKALFPRFKAAFCQDLDGAAIDEATEVVFRQDNAAGKTVSTKAFSELHELAAKTKVEPGTSALAKADNPEPREHLSIRDSRVPQQRRRDDDILDDLDGDEIGTGASAEIDPLEVLGDK